MKKIAFSVFIIAVLLVGSISTVFAAPDKFVGINVVLNTSVNDAVLAELETHGKVVDVLYEIDALTMKVRESELAAVQALPFVAAANPDAERNGAPVDTVAAEDFMNGINTFLLLFQR